MKATSGFNLFRKSGVCSSQSSSSTHSPAIASLIISVRYSSIVGVVGVGVITSAAVIPLPPSPAQVYVSYGPAQQRPAAAHSSRMFQDSGVPDRSYRNTLQLHALLPSLL